MTARKATETGTDTPETTGDSTETAPPAPATHDSGPDLANATPGTETADEVVEHLAPADEHPFAALAKLGNANPDVNVTAVQNGHGTWSWTARATEDGREIAHSGPHHAERVVRDLTLLLAGNSVAIHATALDKPRKLP